MQKHFKNDQIYLRRVKLLQKKSEMVYCYSLQRQLTSAKQPAFHASSIVNFTNTTV